MRISTAPGQWRYADPVKDNLGRFAGGSPHVGAGSLVTSEGTTMSRKAKCSEPGCEFTARSCQEHRQTRTRNVGNPKNGHCTFPGCTKTAQTSGQRCQEHKAERRVRMATCHPEQRYFAKGLCDACYTAARRAKDQAERTAARAAKGLCHPERVRWGGGDMCQSCFDAALAAKRPRAAA